MGYGSRLPPIAAAQRMRPGNEFPVAWRSSACGHRFFVVQYPQGGYRTTCISPLRGDAINFMACRRRRHMPIVPHAYRLSEVMRSISWRAVGDGTCQLYHKRETFMVQYPLCGYCTTRTPPLRGDAINFMACRQRRHMPVIP